MLALVLVLVLGNESISHTVLRLGEGPCDRRYVNQSPHWKPSTRLPEQMTQSSLSTHLSDHHSPTANNLSLTAIMTNQRPSSPSLSNLRSTTLPLVKTRISGTTHDIRNGITLEQISCNLAFSRTLPFLSRASAFNTQPCKLMSCCRWHPYPHKSDETFLSVKFASDMGRAFCLS